MSDAAQAATTMFDVWAGLSDERLHVINVDDRDLRRITAMTWKALVETNEPATLFRFGGNAARIEAADHGGFVVRILNETRLRNELARRMQWVKGAGSSEHPDLPPKHVIENMLAESQMPLPLLSRTVEAPVFGTDGSVDLAPGYHAASRTYYVPDTKLVVPTVADEPTIDDLAEARRLLMDELLADFPFVGDAERAHAVALLLLPFIRELIDGPTPLFMIEKPTPGTGAGLLAQVVMIPALARAPATMTEGGNDDEWRKRLTAKLATGPAAVQIDNLTRTTGVGCVIRGADDAALGGSAPEHQPDDRGARAVCVAGNRK